MKKYIGVLIALVPFFTGAYKNLNNWSDAELVGYNVFNLLLIFFGVYYFKKHHSKRKELDFTKYDIAVSKATLYLHSLKKEDGIEKMTSFNEIKGILDLCRKNQGKWKSQQKVDEIASDLNAFIEDDKEFIDAFQDMEI